MAKRLSTLPAFSGDSSTSRSTRPARPRPWLSEGAFLNVPLASVTSSPLCRAVDTARPVSAASGASLVIDERLSDRFYGELAGHSLAQVEERFGSIDAAPLVEAWQLLEVRAQDAFSEAVGRAETTPKRRTCHPRCRHPGAVEAARHRPRTGQDRASDGILDRDRGSARDSPMERGAPRQGPEQPPTGRRLGPCCAS